MLFSGSRMCFLSQRKSGFAAITVYFKEVTYIAIVIIEIINGWTVKSNNGNEFLELQILFVTLGYVSYTLKIHFLC